MIFANIRELKLETNKVLNWTRKKGPVVVTRHGRPVALLKNISEENMEVQIPSLWNRLRQAAERSGYALKDVDQLIKETRKSFA